MQRQTAIQLQRLLLLLLLQLTNFYSFVDMKAIALIYSGRFYL
ncbi:putative membrane protein [Vibrio parahaemolyticus V-223/04]|nr:putative membrane protein [Vibrio parahaemolyticus V-223/04]